MEKRNVALSVILSIITCGIYMVYWIIVLTDESIEESESQNGTSGALSFLLMIVTCGIYRLYWAYELGNRIDAKNGTTNTGLIYLILSLINLDIVVLALAQNEYNKI